MTEPTSGFAPCTQLLSKLHTFLHCKLNEWKQICRTGALAIHIFAPSKHIRIKKLQKNILEDYQTLILYSLSILARQRIKAIFTLLISPSVYRHLAQSSLHLLWLVPSTHPSSLGFSIHSYQSCFLWYYYTSVKTISPKRRRIYRDGKLSFFIDFLHLFHLFFGLHCNINGGKPQDKQC